MRFFFRIVLHIDDIETLYYIQSRLGVGQVRKHGSHSAVFAVSDFSNIVNKIVPIFQENSLLTTKSLDFNEYLKAVNLKLNSLTDKLTDTDLSTIISIKESMNRSRNEFENFVFNPSSNLKSPMFSSINKYWLLGFVEGEGTFGIKNLTPYFQIGQHNRNVSILNSISLYLERLVLNTTSSSLEATVCEEGCKPST